MTEQEIQKETDKINKMSQYEMAELWRFARLGHRYFDKSLPLWEVFQKRFKALGGMTPEISKSLDF